MATLRSDTTPSPFATPAAGGQAIASGGSAAANAQVAIGALPGANASGVAAPAAGTADARSVYFGTTPRIGGPGRHPGDIDPRPGPTPAVDKTMNAAEAAASFWAWTDAQRKAFGDHLVALGLATAADATRTPVLQAAWEDAVDAAANYYTLGKKKVTPWDALSGMAGIEGTVGKAADSKVARSYTSTSIDLTSPEAAKALITDELSKRLGRAANDGEVSAFTETLNNAQKASPTVTQTNVSADQGTTTSSTSGGVDAATAGQMATDYAKARPDYAEYQAAGTYMNYLFGALSAPIKI